jgi:hypothetical protein
MGPLILILWLLAQSHSCRLPADSTARSKSEKAIAITAALPGHNPITLPEAAPTRYPGQMSMFSAYTGSRPIAPNSELEIRCKTDRSISNVDARVPISGVVQEDVVSLAGNILVPAGAKVFGQGFCNAEHARLLSRGWWNFYLSDHQVRIQGTLWDTAKLEGLPGNEISGGLDENRVKQAIYRDGIYLYVPAGTEFILRLSGEVSVEDLPSAFGK